MQMKEKNKKDINTEYFKGKPLRKMQKKREKNKRIIKTKIEEKNSN